MKAAGIIVKTNRKWRKGVYYSDAPKVNAQPLRSLKQDKYNKIVAITETAARNKLTKFGIIQSKASLVKKQCWKCHKTLKLQSDGSTLRCFSQTDGKNVESRSTRHMMLSLLYGMHVSGKSAAHAYCKLPTSSA